MKSMLIAFTSIAFTTLGMSIYMKANPKVRYIDREVVMYEDRPEVLSVTGTYYEPKSSQCDERPFETADGSIIRSGVRWVALSRDLLKRWGGMFDYGDTVWVYHPHKELRGWWVVRDTMNKRFRQRMDFLVTSGRFPGLSNGVLISKQKII